MSVAAQVVDPEVSRAKFAREVAEFRAQSALHTRRGWWLLEAEFPRVFVVMATAHLRPAAVVLGVEIDFTNYDVEPPSVVLVDPFTREPYRLNTLPTDLPRLRVSRIQIPGGPLLEQKEKVGLMQAAAPDEIPFLCVPGVREYHANPGHSGDSWLLHRRRGEGTLFAILNTVFQYGVQPVDDYAVGLRVVGFHIAEPAQ